MIIQLRGKLRRKELNNYLTGQIETINSAVMTATRKTFSMLCGQSWDKSDEETTIYIEAKKKVENQRRILHPTGELDS